MEAKIDKIAEDVAEIKVTMAEVKKDLAYHIRRTDLLEESVKPVKAHVDSVITIMSVLKAVLGFLGLAGLIMAIKAFVGLV